MSIPPKHTTWLIPSVDRATLFVIVASSAWVESPLSLLQLPKPGSIFGLGGSHSDLRRGDPDFLGPTLVHPDDCYFLELDFLLALLGFSQLCLVLCRSLGFEDFSLGFIKFPFFPDSW